MTRHLDLGANGVFTFNNPQELNQWITANIEAWAFVSATQVAAYKVAVRSLQSILPQIPSDFTDDATWSVFADAIAKVYSRAIRHESPRGAFVIGLKAEGDPVAAGALAIFVKVALHNPIEVQALRGAILGAAYEAANLQALGQAPKVLDSLTHDFRVWWEQSKLEINSEKSLISESRTTIADFQKVTIGQLGALKSETDASLTKLTDTHRTATQDLSNLVNSQVSEFTSKLRELTQSHSEKMAAIERTYEEKLALHEAASYWRKKLAYHKKMSMTYGIAFAASLVGSVGLIVLLLTVATIGGEPLLPKEVNWSRVPLGRVVLIGSIATALVWAVKTLARLFFSNLHLHADADERVVMVTTYLALMKESAAITDDDRRLVIEVLFRRASTGIVKQDAEPPFIVGSILKRSD